VAARLTWRVRRALLPGLLVAAALLAGCANLEATPSAGQPAAPVGSPAVGPAAAAARAAVFDALGQANLIVADTATPFRPPEAEPLAAAPRSVYQVTLPKDPDGGFVVVYELPSEADAQAAAEAQRAYLASGPGRVQSPPGTDHVIQQLGSALIVYDWLPADAEDPNTPRVAEVLRTVGTSFEIGS
jgi:hypothetical protein